MRIRWKAALPAAGVLLGIAASPSVLAVLPDKWAHVVIGISGVVAIFAPALVTNRPPSQPVD